MVYVKCLLMCCKTDFLMPRVRFIRTNFVSWHQHIFSRMGHGRIEAGLHWVANGVRFRGHGFKSRLHLSNSQIIDMNPAASARWHLLSAPLKMTSYIPVSGVSNPVLDVPNLLEIVVVAREWCLSAGTKPFSTHGRLTRSIMLRMRREWRERFSPPPISKETVIPACLTARASRTCRDACRDHLPVVAGKTFSEFPAHAHAQF